MSTNEAFVAGYNAYWVDVDSDDNPYKPGTGKHRSWDEGWSQAELEDEDVIATARELAGAGLVRNEGY
jgi:hypothetical protein